MKKYSFRAKDLDGKVYKDECEAPGENELITEQLKLGRHVYWIQEAKAKKDVKQFSSKELSDFSHELSVMLKSGLTIISALNVMSDNKSASRRVRAACNDLSALLKHEFSFSEACGMQGGAFPELIVNAFHSGELSGKLGDAAEQMARHYESNTCKQRKIGAATSYSKLSAMLTLGIVIIMFIFILLPRPRINAHRKPTGLPEAARALEGAQILASEAYAMGRYKGVEVTGDIEIPQEDIEEWMGKKFKEYENVTAKSTAAQAAISGGIIDIFEYNNTRIKVTIVINDEGELVVQEYGGTN